MRFICITLLLLLSKSVTSAEIALTFDDAPTGDSIIMTGAARTNKIAKALRDASVPDALFFVKTDAISAKSKTRLHQYVGDGYHLANHSHSHISANKISVNEYLQDVYSAHLRLKPFDNVLPFHRFPYLHYGGSRGSIDDIQVLLAELNYKNGYVTVDNYDWYMNAILLKATKEGKTIDYEKFGEVYVNVIWQAIEFYDNIAKRSLGRSPKHVLLLHENDTSAIYLSRLIEHIKAKGWTIISPQEAYQDPIADVFPKGIFHKQGRVAALAHEAGVAIKKLRHPAENEQYLDVLFEKEDVFK